MQESTCHDGSGTAMQRGREYGACAGDPRLKKQVGREFTLVLLHWIC